MREEEYIRLDATALAGLVRGGEVSAIELLELALARLARWNPAINAVVIELAERARRDAAATLPAGPFAGVPFLVKDLDGFLAGAEFTASSRALLGYVPPRDSELFRRYRDAGLVICGKTNTPEFGLVGTTESLLRGPARNPWNPAYSCGGSSGGSAAAVAARIVPMAHGGDGGGSIRIPASACGLFGLKPTRGRTPMGPDESEAWSGFVQRHAITRTVRDSAMLLDATQGYDAGAPYTAPPPQRPYAGEVGRDPGRLRIAFSTRSLFGRDTHPDCVAAVRAAAALLEHLGHEVTEAHPPIEREALVHAYLVVVAACTAGLVRQIGKLRGRRVRGRELEPTTQFLATLGEALPAGEFEFARLTFHAASRALAPFFAAHDVFVDATLAFPPPRIGEWALAPQLQWAIRSFSSVLPRAVMRRALDHFAADGLERTANTMLFNMSGQPAMSVPLHVNAEGLPIGVQCVGGFGDEATLFRLAAQLEQAAPWIERMPAEPAAH
ncbi:MAG: amidase [Gammaproteobacteria bacterium]|nr:amidase [Gammaproteobacteria bacterium]MBK9469275.1 amidase [Gammaproteobacteria bacterium]MBP6481598.1 amidase [Pseudomonadales bacterium]MBP7909004.1 amidase [Pseudomonadales bacterium]